MNEEATYRESQEGIHTEIIRAPLSQTILLPSGRQLGIAEQGDPQGKPVLFFHGFAGSRLQCPADGALVARIGVRLISIDRPGIGLSDRAPGRHLLDWATDIKQLADHLKLQQFAILGWSAGGPHALACAFALPEQVVALGLASPMGGWFIGSGATRHISPEARGITTLARFAPWVLRLALKQLQQRITHHAGRVVVSQLRQLPSTDRATLADPLNQRLLIETLGEAFRSGVHGVFDDTLVVAHPWGFAPDAIATPTWIWQGDADTSVLPALAEELAQKLQQSQMMLFPGEGHFLLFTHWQQMLQTLALAFQRPPATHSKPASWADSEV